MKKQDKQEWINEAMNSLDGIQRASAPESVYSNLERRINSEKVIRLGNDRVVPLKWISVAAAVLIMLVSVNFFTLRQEQRAGFSRNKIDKLARYYQLTDNSPLYNL